MRKQVAERANYRPSGRGNTVLIEHHKTGKQIAMPLRDREGPLFPELTQYLDSLERLGVPIVLMKPKRPQDGEEAVPRPFKFRTARIRIRKIARAAGLPDYLMPGRLRKKAWHRRGTVPRRSESTRKIPSARPPTRSASGASIWRSKKNRTGRLSL